MRHRHSLIAIAALAYCATAAGAQQAESSTYSQRASAAVLGLPFGLISGEYERAVTREVSLGAAAGFIEIDDEGQAWGDVKVRYYPSARAPGGFSIGALVGVTRIDPWDDDYEGAAIAPPRSGATAGVFIDYGWLLGRSRRFYVGAGVGAKRVFGMGDDPNGDYPEILAAHRLQIGYAF